MPDDLRHQIVYLERFDDNYANLLENYLKAEKLDEVDQNLFFQRDIGVFSVSASAISASVTSASATMFFPNYQLTNENLSPKTDNICIDGLCQQLQSMKGAKKCFQLRQNDKNSFFS